MMTSSMTDEALFCFSAVVGIKFSRVQRVWRVERVESWILDASKTDEKPRLET
jgi:hypothetical protein